MIISASRRTDLPAWFLEWFCRRVEEGFVLVRNPMNPHQISRVSLDAEAVDCVVFWTKNPKQLLRLLPRLKRIPFVVQYTLNAYGTEIETGLRDSPVQRVELFRSLSEAISPRRITWRYDPILLSEKYSVDFHVDRFRRLAERLAGLTERCVISFVDSYRNTRRNEREMGLLPVGDSDMKRIGREFAQIGREFGIQISTCAEKVDLSEWGIGHGACIDGEWILQALGIPLFGLKKDPGQRRECGCVESVDIGAYNTCGNGCRYCYANYNPAVIQSCMDAHDPDSPLLYGALGPGDRIYERKAVSFRDAQLEMFSTGNRRI